MLGCTDTMVVKIQQDKKAEICCHDSGKFAVEPQMSPWLGEVPASTAHAGSSDIELKNEKKSKKV
jgi:hypothetical protein